MPADFYPPGFHVDHIVARQHGGATDLGNLALACLHCNRHKGPNLTGIDPLTGSITPLFNPRRDVWSQHFQWREAELLGRTATGRCTIAVLAINAPDFQAVREWLKKENRFPLG
jgi:hypothetical protein